MAFNTIYVGGAAEKTFATSFDFKKVFNYSLWPLRIFCLVSGARTLECIVFTIFIDQVRFENSFAFTFISFDVKYIYI